jgi:radical SAM superfamily enzyme YgiQ (UPF0313 family)
MSSHPDTPKRLALLVGIAGSYNAFSLSLYNLKALAQADEAVRSAWHLRVLQLPLVGELVYRERLEEIARLIADERPALLACSVYMWNTRFFTDLAERVKQSSPGTRIVFGGPEMATDYLREGRYDSLHVDFCVSGEGELTFRDLLRELSRPEPDLGGIPGLSFRAGEGAPFTTNPRRTPVRSLAEIPSPFLTGVVDEDVLRRPNVEANLETQRGCNLRCAYCIYHKDMDRISYNEIRRTLDEVAHVTQRGVRRIRFVDANFGSDLAHAKAVMRGLIQMRPETRLMFELIPGFIDEELASLFAEFRSLHPWNDITLGVGVQTINYEPLKLMRRGIKLVRFERTFALLKKHQLYAKIDLILGLPSESLADIERTLEYMLETLRDHSSHLLCCHVMRGLPGTELLTIAERHGLVFTSRHEPHELYESPTLPRADMLRCLRRTAVIFRMVNHEGWADREFVDPQDQRPNSRAVHDAYFRAKDRLSLPHMALLDRLVDGFFAVLPRRSFFVQDDFPFAETWWWAHSKHEVGTEWLVRFLDGL